VAKIAFLLPDLGAGGAERVAIGLMRSFRERGHEVEFVLMQKQGELLDQIPDEVRIVDLGVKRIREAIWPLVRYFRESHPDAVQARMWPLTVAAIIARRLARSPARLVVSDHISLSHQHHLQRAKLALLKLSTRLFYPMADARICVSEGVAQDLARLSGIPRSKFFLVYNPVAPPSQASPHEGSERIWGCAEARLLSVGTLKTQKNHGLLIDAFSRVADALDAKLVIVGDGQLRADLQRRIGELGLDDRVELVGHKADPSPYYATADLLVLSSDYEGFAIVIVEALHHGLKVVSTDCPYGPAEILGRGQFGRLVPVGDAEALARAMTKELGRRRDPQAQRARAADFSPARATEAYLEALLGHGQSGKSIAEAQS